MSKVSANQLKTYFQTGLKPTQSNFEDLIDSCFNDPVAWSDIQNKPAWIGSTKPSYSYDEIANKPTISAVIVNTVSAGGLIEIGNQYNPTGAIIYQNIELDIAGSLTILATANVDQSAKLTWSYNCPHCTLRITVLTVVSEYSMQMLLERLDSQTAVNSKYCATIVVASLTGSDAKNITTFLTQQ